MAFSRRFTRIPALLRRGGRSPAAGGGGVAPTITVAPVLAWTVAHGSSPTITEGTYTGDAGTWTYDLVRLPSTTVLSGASKATVEAYTSDRATDIGYEWKVTGTITNGSGSDADDSNVVEWYPDAWSPRNLYDAGTVTLVGSDVDSWDELIGGRDLIAASAAVRPAYSASGFNGGSQPYVEGDGASEYLERGFALNDFWSSTTPSPTIGAYTAVVVWSEQSRVNNREILHVSGPSTSSGPRLRQLTASTAQIVNAALSVASTGPTTPTTAAIEVSADGTNQRIYYNGTIQDTDATTSVLNTLGNSAIFAVFARANGTTPSNGRAAMVIALERVLTSDERADFAAYCGVRWGL